MWSLPPLPEQRTLCLSLDQRVLGEPHRLTGSTPMATASEAMRRRTIGPCGGRRCSQWQRTCVCKPPLPLPRVWHSPTRPRPPPLLLVVPRSGQIHPIHTRIWPNHPAAAAAGHQDGGGNRPRRRRVPRIVVAPAARVTTEGGA
ncbi:hypothetical protein VPH35_126581 [Triticum aestivum]